MALELLVLDEQTHEVKINAPWIKDIPQLKALFSKRSSRTTYDSDTAGRKRLTYIYYMLAFNSPIATWAEDKKHQEAINYSGIDPLDTSSNVVVEAMAKYTELQYELCRELKSYRAALKGLEAMDQYLETMNFNKTDKQGKLLYTPNQFIGNVALTNKAYDEMDKLWKRVEEKMTASKSARGSISLGDKELKAFNSSTTAKATRPVKPSQPDEDDEQDEEDGDNMVNWTDLSSIINPDK